MRATVLLAVAALAMPIMGCGASAQTQTHRTVTSARVVLDPLMRRFMVRDPSTFVDVEYTDTGSPSAIELRSAASGKVVKVLEGPRSVDYQDGALSADGRYLYVARAPGWIDRITLATRSTHRVARGQNPAISPDGRLLAYNTGRLDSTPVVRDLGTGVARTIDLGGHSPGPDDSITWLGDSSTLVLAPQPTPRNCGNVQTSVTCLIIVDLAAGGPQAAHRLVIPGQPGAAFIHVAGVDTKASMLLLAREFPGGHSTLTRVKVSDAGASVVNNIPLGERQPVAFSPTGRRIIYQTDTPRALWSASIGRHHLTHGHRLTGPGFWGATGAW